MMQGSLAMRLRVLRAERGLSLTEAAERAGIQRQTLALLERGERHPHDPTLAKIAKGYGVPIEDLLEEPALAGTPGKAEAPDTGPQKSRAGSAAEGHLTIHRTMEDIEENLTPEQVREILAGILDGRITVEAARQLLAQGFSD
jgi:transcriptional regulator with XRE-family HTH domain